MSKIVFTNGCFDILHAGHVDLLQRAKALGDKLIVGLNSDSSVRSVKGADRPFIKQEQRAAILRGLNAVDEVIIFEELTPEQLIQNIKPDVLVKGGDWSVDEIVGSAFVRENGGEVVSIPLLPGYSSSAIVEKIRGNVKPISRTANSPISASFDEHLATIEKTKIEQQDAIERTAKLLIKTVKSGNKVLIVGNGGSAADAQHLAAEFVGRYETERTALPAIALTTDTSALTAITNDYSFDKVFARQVEALASKGDCLIAISTSGNSPNVINAVMAARNRGCSVIGMTGKNGKKLAGLSDESIMIPSTRTARIQETHILISHIWCELIDKEYSDEK